MTNLGSDQLLQSIRVGYRATRCEVSNRRYCSFAIAHRDGINVRS